MTSQATGSGITRAGKREPRCAMWACSKPAASMTIHAVVERVPPSGSHPSLLCRRRSAEVRRGGQLDVAQAAKPERQPQGPEPPEGSDPRFRGHPHLGTLTAQSVASNQQSGSVSRLAEDDSAIGTVPPWWHIRPHPHHRDQDASRICDYVLTPQFGHPLRDDRIASSRYQKPSPRALGVRSQLGLCVRVAKRKHRNHPLVPVHSPGRGRGAEQVFRARVDRWRAGPASSWSRALPACLVGPLACWGGVGQVTALRWRCLLRLLNVLQLPLCACGPASRPHSPAAQPCCD